LSPEGGRPGRPIGSQAYMLRKFRNSYNIKIAPHKQKSIVKKMANGALCLSTPKHNGKSGTDHRSSYFKLK